jgi:hypothetical protein
LSDAIGRGPGTLFIPCIIRRGTMETWKYRKRQDKGMKEKRRKEKNRRKKEDPRKGKKEKHTSPHANRTCDS